MSIRFVLLLAICVALALLCTGTTGQTTVSRSGRELDFAIVGHGYFVVSDIENAEVRYTRAGGMNVNEFDQLVVSINSQEWLLDPPIQLPSDWQRIAVQHDGEVQCLAAGGYWTDIGQIQFARFSRTPAFENMFDANMATDDSGPPIIGSPSDTQSIIQQSWIEKPRSSSLILARNLLIALFACIVVNALALQRNTITDTSTEPQNAREIAD
ncbi:MAG: hypothetical protein AAGG48_23355 [Planctomycetota bacterium]